MSSTLRRLAVGAAAMAAAATVATPAYAASAVKVTTALPAVTVAAGATAEIDPLLYASKDVEFGNGGTMTFALSGSLDGVSLSNSDDDPTGCTSAGAQKLVCSVPYPIDLDSYGDEGYFAAKIGATAAALGETGKLTTTLTIAGLAPVVTTVDVDVAEAVNLTAGADTKVTTAPGGAFNATFSVHNSSEATAHGVAIVFGTPYAFQAVKYSNCFYDGDELNACVFNQDLASGRNYGLTVPYQTRQDTAAPTTDSIDSEWLTGDDYNDLIASLQGHGVGPGVAGTGGTLSLTELSATQSRIKQTDPDMDDNDESAVVTIGGKQAFDLAAIGATFTGTAGQVVPVTVGIQNKGPATFAAEDGPGVAADVTLPAGTIATTVPADCFNLAAPGDTPETEFFCFADKDSLAAGTSVSWAFKVKVNKAATSTGSIALDTDCHCAAFQLDTDKADNTAKIALNPTTGGGGSTSGSLPITGPRAATAGGAGILLVAAGVIGFVITRRRRTRFEA